jgi:acyl-CoA synthetase (AMP-forming)/AMP-acid ligase II
MTETIHALLDAAAEARPDAPALLGAEGVTTYAAQAAATRAMAEHLAARGLRRGDRLMIVAENGRMAATLIFAASRLGAVFVPVNARMTGTELDRIEAHATPRLVAYTTDVSPDAARHAAGSDPQDTDAGAFALRPGAHAPGEHATEDTAVILYTTGTTGDPKGVMLTHGNLRFGGRTSATLRGMRPDDRIYGVLPVTHVFGLASMLMAATSVGASIQFEPRFAPDRLHAALVDGATVFPGVPQMHALLMAHVTAQGADRLQGVPLRYVSSGAAPLDPAWKRKAEGFYGLPLQNGYGMTETTAGVCATSNAIGDPDISVGPALPGVEIRLDTALGGDDAAVGEVLTRGPHVMLGYWRNPEETARVLQDGWMRTGDLGRLEGDRLHIVGRAKELIIRGGFNVYPPEVEAALNDHPDVIQSAVVGRRVAGDEEVVAFVQVADPARFDRAALAAFAAERLAPYKRPARIVAATALPAAPTGKLLKHRMLAQFAGELEAE